MKKYERLTCVIDGEARVMETEFESKWAMQKAVDRLAELEDKIENGTLIELPCVRQINSGLGKYEAVFLPRVFDTIQECVVGSIQGGWEIIAYYGNARHKAIAEAKLRALRGEQV